MADVIRQRCRMPHYWACCLGLAVLFSCVSSFSAHYQEIVFETDFIRLVLDSTASIQSLVEKETAEDWLAEAPTPFAFVKKGGQYFHATQLTQIGELWRVDFGNAQVQVDVHILPRREYVVFEVAQVYGQGVDEVVFAAMRVRCQEDAGGWLIVRRNERFAVSLLGLSECVHVQLLDDDRLAASVYPEFGIEGEGAALVAAPTSQLLDVIQKVERECELPSPRLGGQWAKTSEAVRTSYLFTDLTKANVDETIRWARLGGFQYILIYAGTWSASCGSYPVNRGNFPHGEADLKAVVEKCHAAGLKVGLHFNTSMIDKSDPIVQAELGTRLLKAGEATLAGDIDEDMTEIVVTGLVESSPSQGDIQIDDELIRYRRLSMEDSATLSDCTRGFAGTRVTPHKAGAKVYLLAEQYGHYLADLRTTLKADISERVAGIINTCGFDMVYFDGGECNALNGPAWYWVGQQQSDVCRRLTREVLVQGSGYTPWLWHCFARGCCDDFAAVAVKQYLDHRKIADAWMFFSQNFMPAELGWWGLLVDGLDHPATMPDDVEYYASRMLSLDTPVSLETNLTALQQNGRAEEMLGLLRSYEELRLGRTVPDTTKEKLMEGEWRLSRIGDQQVLLPVRYDVHRIDVPGSLQVTNGFSAQAMKFRLQAVPQMAPLGSDGNVHLLEARSAVELPLPKIGVPMPGALVGRVTFDNPLDLSCHRALAVRLHVDGLSSGFGQVSPVLNVQLETGAGRYRDYYIDLTSTGEQVIIIPESTTERMLPEFCPDPRNYAFKAAMSGFAYHNVTALNLRWMRSPVDGLTKCRVTEVEALAELDATLRCPTLTIGSKTLTISEDLRVGDYAEFWADSPLKVFDRNGDLLTSLVPENDPPMLKEGVNVIAVHAAEPASVKLTIISTGTYLHW